VKWFTNRHVGRGDDTSLDHHHRRVIAHRVEFAQAKRFEGDQRFHALVAWIDQYFDRVEGDAVDEQELLQVLENNLRQVMDLLVE